MPEKSWFQIFVTSTRSSFQSNHISVICISAQEVVRGESSHTMTVSNCNRGVSFMAYVII